MSQHPTTPPTGPVVDAAGDRRAAERFAGLPPERVAAARAALAHLPDRFTLEDLDRLGVTLAEQRHAERERADQLAGWHQADRATSVDTSTNRELFS